MSQEQQDIISVTVLTGFLGSGKTTVLKHLLQQPHGYKIAIIENEFGSENIDHDLLMHNEAEQIIQMSNGCICCNIRGDLKKGLLELRQGRLDGRYQFNHIVIETTGLAEPSPIVQTFFLDETLATFYRLDGVITVVDAKFTAMHLKTHVEVQKQIGFADKLLISKSDLVDETSLKQLQHALTHINAKAKQVIVNQGQIDVNELFNLQGFHLNDQLDLPKIEHKAHKHTHEHTHAHTHEHKHEHNETCLDTCTHEHHEHQHEQTIDLHNLQVKSFAYTSQKPFIYEKLEAFLGNILKIYGEKLLRYKGVLHMKDVDRKVILQGVHELMASEIGKPWTEKPKSKLVFIGIDLPIDILQQGLEKCH